MSQVTFVPKEGTEYTDGFPDNVVGDGFIHLELMHVEHGGDIAMYRDQLYDEYEFIGADQDEWTVEVRED